MTQPAPHQIKVGDLVRRKADAPGGFGQPSSEFEVKQLLDDGQTIIGPDGRNHYWGYLEITAAGHEEPAQAEDVVNHPSHYKAGKFEAIEVIEAFDLNRDFRLGNAAKYLLRAGKKADELEDLKKAAKYLSRYIAELETGTPAW